MEEYQQQYCSITADIVATTGKIIKLSGFEKQQTVKNVESQIKDAKDVLDHMKQETLALPAKLQDKYTTLVQSYQNELLRLEKELVTIKNRKAHVAFSNEVLVREELLNLEDFHSADDDDDDNDDQNARLLGNSDALEVSRHPVGRTYKMALVTENFDAPALEDLHSQRTVLQRTGDRYIECAGVNFTVLLS